MKHCAIFCRVSVESIVSSFLKMSQKSESRPELTYMVDERLPTDITLRSLYTPVEVTKPIEKPIRHMEL